MLGPLRTVVRLVTIGVVALAALIAPTSAGATIVWTATMEKGDLSEWTSQTNGTITLADGGVRTNIEASTERPYTGAYSCKVTVHPDDDYGMYHQDRADTKHVSTLTGEGKDSYLSGYYFLPEDAKTRNEIAFYETTVKSMNWMDLWVEPKMGGGTAVKFGIESNGANLGSVLVWTGDWKAGVWHQFAIHVHWSIDPTKGVVDLWFDGQPVVVGYKHQTKYNTSDNFFQTGLHRVLMQPYTETIYLDDFIEADTLAEMKVAVPNPNAGGNATDGGTDAAGAAGAGGGAAGTAGAAGAAGTTGAAGASSTGTGGTSGSAGASSNGTAGAGMTMGAAGASSTGTAGAGTSAGAAGTPGTGGSHAHSSSGCAIAASSSGMGLGAIIAMLGAALASRRKRPSP
jgi:hypothetical protein